MKYLILLTLLFSNLLFAESEEEHYLRSIKEVEVEGQILEQIEQGDCKKNAQNIKDLEARNTQIRNCFQNKLDSLGEEEVREFSKNINLKSYDLQATKDVPSTRKYLSERLEKAIHGKDYDPTKNRLKAKQRKYIDQSDFIKMYKAQVGKNILLEISQYCLENLRNKNGDHYKVPCKNEPPGAKWSGCMLASEDSPIWNELKEVEFKYDKSTTEKEKSQENINNEKQIQKEFKRGPEYLKVKYAFCTTAIDKMCRRYDNIKRSKEIKKNESFQIREDIDYNKVKYNREEVDIKLADDKGGKLVGRKACLLEARLKDYRKNLQVLDLTEEAFNKMKNATSGYDNEVFGQIYKGIYGDKQDEKSIDEITTITSRDVGLSLDTEKNKEEFEVCEKAGFDSEECATFVNKDEEEFKNVEVEFEATTALKLKEMEKLKNDEIKNYLNQNAMSNYLKKFEEGTLTEDQIKEIIQQKYKSERLALINELRDKLNQNTLQKSPDPKANQDAEKNDILTKVKNEIEGKKDRLENLFRYSNVITSYLEIAGEDGEENSQNVTGLKEELRIAQEENEGEEYFENLSIDDQNVSDSNQAVFVNINVIDQLLGNEVEKENNNGN